MNRRLLALMADAELSHDNAGDESNHIAPVEVDPNAVSDLEFRMKVSIRLLEVEKQVEQTRRMVNRIITRFAVDGRPLPPEEKISA
jgi:uncharacterized protein (DUF1499 family)